jgi:hypothetical protein
LKQWDKSIACYQEAARLSEGDDRLQRNRAVILHNWAGVLRCCGQYDLAIPLLEQSLAISRALDEREEIALAAKSLQLTREQAEECRRDRESASCHQCKATKCTLVCPCYRAWYCSIACQTRHWATHKPRCNVCLGCDMASAVVQRCSRCKTAKYCSTSCATSHWRVHKKDCIAPVGKGQEEGK